MSSKTSAILKVSPFGVGVGVSVRVSGDRGGAAAAGSAQSARVACPGRSALPESALPAATHAGFRGGGEPRLLQLGPGRLALYLLPISFPRKGQMFEGRKKEREERDGSHSSLRLVSFPSASSPGLPTSSAVVFPGL